MTHGDVTDSSLFVGEGGSSSEHEGVPTAVSLFPPETASPLSPNPNWYPKT